MGVSCQFSNEITCNGRGSVDEHGDCICRPGWSEQWTHDGRCAICSTGHHPSHVPARDFDCMYSDATTCSGRGTVSDSGLCSCDTQHFGQHCENEWSSTPLEWNSSVIVMYPVNFEVLFPTGNTTDFENLFTENIMLMLNTTSAPNTVAAHPGSVLVEVHYHEAALMRLLHGKVCNDIRAFDISYTATSATNFELTAEINDPARCVTSSPSAVPTPPEDSQDLASATAAGGVTDKISDLEFIAYVVAILFGLPLVLLLGIRIGMPKGCSKRYSHNVADGTVRSSSKRDGDEVTDDCFMEFNSLGSRTSPSSPDSEAVTDGLQFGAPMPASYGRQQFPMQANAGGSLAHTPHATPSMGSLHTPTTVSRTHYLQVSPPATEQRKAAAHSPVKYLQVFPPSQPGELSTPATTPVAKPALYGGAALKAPRASQQMVLSTPHSVEAVSMLQAVYHQGYLDSDSNPKFAVPGASQQKVLSPRHSIEVASILQAVHQQGYLDSDSDPELVMPVPLSAVPEEPSTPANEAFNARGIKMVPMLQSSRDTVEEQSSRAVDAAPSDHAPPAKTDSVVVPTIRQRSARNKMGGATVMAPSPMPETSSMLAGNNAEENVNPKTVRPVWGTPTAAANPVGSPMRRQIMVQHAAATATQSVVSAVLAAGPQHQTSSISRVYNSPRTAWSVTTAATPENSVRPATITVTPQQQSVSRVYVSSTPRGFADPEGDGGRSFVGRSLPEYRRRHSAASQEADDATLGSSALSGSTGGPHYLNVQQDRYAQATSPMGDLLSHTGILYSTISSAVDELSFFGKLVQSAESPTGASQMSLPGTVLEYHDDVQDTAV